MTFSYQCTQPGWDGSYTGVAIPSPTTTAGDGGQAVSQGQMGYQSPNDYPGMPMGQPGLPSQ